MKTLILGGIRSGKSRFAERLAHSTGLAVSYIATATPGDGEMAARIAEHRRRRPTSWKVVEETHQLAKALMEQAAPDRCLIVDCLTLWLTNLLMSEEASHLQEECTALLKLLPTLPGHCILVGNETSMGIVPLGATTRRFCDLSGRLHQDLAVLCDRVILLVSGLPLVMKGELQ